MDSRLIILMKPSLQNGPIAFLLIPKDVCVLPAIIFVQGLPNLKDIPLLCRNRQVGAKIDPVTRMSYC